MATLTASLPDLDLPRFDPPKVDMPEVFANAMNAAGIRRSSPRRWPFALAGIVVAGVAGWAVLNNEAIRSRLTEAVQSVRQRFAAMRSPNDNLESIAFPAAETMPIEPSPVAEYETPEAADYPAGLGAPVTSKT